jgi:O-antigen/teichoic acid export membrane protein
MASKEKVSELEQTHRWQALVSVLLGFGSWLLASPLVAVRGAGTSQEGTIGMVIVAAVSLLPSLFGLGLAAAAIRVRGDRMVAATCGLALNGAQIGTVTGLVLLVIWKR